MPSPQEILDELEAIANDWRTIGIAWHVVLGAGLIALGLGWRPGRRLTGTLLASPLASVSAVAWQSGNPFNGTTFSVIAAALAGLALSLPHAPIRISTPWLVVPGVSLVVFGWVYPHFLQTDSWAPYLYASPLGLIPCPTLSAVTSVALVIEGLGSRSWSLMLAGSGVLYGLIGWLRLGVTIDTVLLVGATTLAAAAVSRPGVERA
jgi:hypothetical protein